MKYVFLGSKGRLGRHFGVTFAIVAMFAAICGGASAQAPTYAWVTVVPAGTPPVAPVVCGPASSGYMICVDPDPVSTPAVSPDTDVEIIWNLDGSSGWSFDKNKGIDIKNKKNWKPKRISSTQYIAYNKKENGATLYTYKINLSKGSSLLAWDPTIMN